MLRFSELSSSDNKWELFIKTDVDSPSAQLCQLERKEEQTLPKYTSAWHLETPLTAGTKLHDKSSCEHVCGP